MNVSELAIRLARIEKLLLGTKCIFTLSEASEYTGIAKATLYKYTSYWVLSKLLTPLGTQMKLPTQLLYK